MATQEHIAEAMNAMQRQIAELASQLAEERHRSANLDRVAQVLDRWTTQQAQQPSSDIGGHEGNWTPVKLRQWRGKEFGEKLPSVAEEDAELHHQCIPGSSGTARVGRNDSTAHHLPTRGTTIRLRSGSYRSSDGSGGQDASSLCGVDASDRG